MKRLYFLTPLALIVAGAACALLLQDGLLAGAARLHPGQTYFVWPVEAEVAAQPTPGDRWDADGSAPDLFAVVIYRGTIVLRTHAAKDALIARWDPHSVGWRDVLAAEASPATVRKVATITPQTGDELTIDLFDEDLVSASQVGGIRVPVAALREGENELVCEEPDVRVRRVRLVVSPASAREPRGAGARRTQVAAESLRWHGPEAGGCADPWEEVARELHERAKEALGGALKKALREIEGDEPPRESAGPR